MPLGGYAEKLAVSVGVCQGMRLAPPGSMDQETQAAPTPPAAPAVAPDVTVAVDPEPQAFARRHAAVAGLAVLGGGVITYALMGRPATAPPSAAGTPTPAIAEPARRPTAAAVKVRPWSAARRELWIGERRKGVAFDVDANEPVSAWMKLVRPILVVRCTGGTLDAFVMTDTAAAIEPRSEAHTVRLRFDGQSPVSERWPDSEEHDALFAPDGAAFAARLANAQVFEFGFTPHNAAPVVARFSVAGLAPLLDPAKKHCGLK